MTASFVIGGNGITRVLVEADDATEALERYLMTSRLARAVGIRDELVVRPATDADLADFRARNKRAGKPAENLTLLIDLPPARKRRRVRSDEHA